MLSAKSDETASKYRSEGSELLNESKFYEALVAYNKCLSYAEKGSVEFSMAFEGRSRVYYEVGQWEKCVKNICAAKNHGFPQELIKPLDELEEKCKTLLVDNKVTPDEDIWGFLKLSHPPKQKIPFIADCLEIRENEKFGRFVVTTRDLEPGDVVAIEEPQFNFICPSATMTNCFNCLNSNMLDLIPSSASVMFCSEKCHDEAYKKFNCRDELIKDSMCGNDIRQKMMRIMSDSLSAAGSFEELQLMVEKLDGKSVFNFDLSDPKDVDFKKKFLICVSSLMPKTDSGVVSSYLKNILALREGPRKDFFVNFIAKIILNYMRNGVKLPGKGTNVAAGGMHLPFTAMLNHSCDPNIHAGFVDNKCHLIVMQPVKANEEVFVNYRKTFMEQPKDTRRSELLKSYEFFCECSACSKDYQMPNKLPRFDKAFKFPNFGQFESNKALLSELKENFQYIKDNYESHPCFETAAALMRNKELIRTICERASFPFDSIKSIS